MVREGGETIRCVKPILIFYFELFYLFYLMMRIVKLKDRNLKSHLSPK